MNKEAFHEHKNEKGHEEDDGKNVIGADGKCSNARECEEQKYMYKKYPRIK